MHIRKSILIATAALILFLTAALGYLVGRSSQVAPSTSPTVEPALSKMKVVVSKVPAQPPIAPSNEAIAKVKPEQKVESAKVGLKPFTAAEQRLIDDWAEAMEMCRGSSDEASQAVWCPRYTKAQAKLNSIGICFGHDDDRSAAEYDIHRCRKGSYRD